MCTSEKNLSSCIVNLCNWSRFRSKSSSFVSFQIKCTAHEASIGLLLYWKILLRTEVSEWEREKINPILGLMKVANVIWIIIDSFLYVCCELWACMPYRWMISDEIWILRVIKGQRGGTLKIINWISIKILKFSAANDAIEE